MCFIHFYQIHELANIGKTLGTMLIKQKKKENGTCLKSSLHEIWSIGKIFFLAIAACPVLQKKDPRRGGGPKNIQIRIYVSKNTKKGS